nr:glycosyltransferase [Acetobacter oeni]
MSVYNCERYISETLASIQAQTIKDIHIIIVDDGSTDRTGELVARAANNDERIIYHRQDNAGIVSALNAGLQYCKAEFIARHDGDDISYPERFEAELAYLETNPDCVAVSSVARHIDENGLHLGTISTRKDLTAADCFSVPAEEPYLLQPMLMLRRSALEMVGGYRNISVAEDSDLLWRLNAIGTMHIISDPLGDYRVHNASVSSQSVVHGRRLAVWSQLAAISEQRRLTKTTDLNFSSELKIRIESAMSLADMASAVRELLTEVEINWFGLAVSAKLLEICYYRPYEPEGSDITFIRHVTSSDENTSRCFKYAKLKEDILAAAIRLTLGGRWKDALKLLPPERWPVLFARAVFRVAFPSSVKSIIKGFTVKRKSPTRDIFNRFADFLEPLPSLEGKPQVYCPPDSLLDGKPSVAYLIMAHSQDKQLECLVNALLSDPRSRVYIHMDAKTTVDQPFNFKDSFRVMLVADRIRVNWGGFSVVKATQAILRAALSDKRNERFVLLSGACFPTQSPSAVNDELLRGEGNLFSVWGQIGPNNLSSEGFGRYVVSKFQPCDIGVLNPKKSIFHARLWNLYKKIASKCLTENELSDFSGL